MSEHKFEAIVVQPDEWMFKARMTFADVQKAVVGYVEPANGPGGTIVCVNEDGRQMRLPHNRVASMFVGFNLVGVAVIVGNDGEEFGDAPDGVWDVLDGYRSPRETFGPSGAVLDGSGAVNSLSGDEARLVEATMLLRSHGYQVLSPKPHANPKVRSGAPDTSKAVEPRLNSGLGKVLEALRFAGWLGATDDELEIRLGLTHQSVSAARRNGVIRGLIYDSGEKRRTRSGNQAIVWKAVQS